MGGFFARRDRWIFGIDFIYMDVEDKLNDEVRTLLMQHDAMLRNNDVTYHEMFKKVKGISPSEVI